jgi:hypothetical protein
VREHGGSLRRARCQANGLAHASTLEWMRVEPQQRDAHPTEDHNESMNLPTSVAERVNTRNESAPIPRYLRACFTSREPPSVPPVNFSIHSDYAFAI